MAIKLADTARPNNYVDTEHPGTFPVAYAEDVWFADGTRLSEKTFDGQSVQKEELPLASATEEGNIYQYIGVNGTYTNGYFYKCVEDSGSYSWVNIQVQDAGAETIVDVNSVPVSGISNVIYRTTDLSGDASYYAGNETASNTDQLAKYSDIQIIQVETLETANSTLEGTIVQYIGATGNGLYNGYFYKCVEVETSQYEWLAWNVQEDNAVPHWSGTRAEYEAIKDTLEAGTYVSITDDYDDGLEVVDVIESGNMNPVTSNAVAEALAEGDVEKTYFIPTPSSGSVVAADCWYIRKGNVVTVSIGIASMSASEPGETVFTLPVGLRPCANRVICIGCNNNYVSNCNIQIGQNGNINVVCNVGCFGTATYVTE